MSKKKYFLNALFPEIKRFIIGKIAYIYFVYLYIKKNPLQFLWKISSQTEVYFMVKKGWFALHQFLCLCICDTFTVMKTHPNQLSICHLNNISVKDLTYVWLCCQDMSRGKFDVVPFFELELSQVASASLKSPPSPKAAVPLRWSSTVLFVSPCPLPPGMPLSSPSAGTQFAMEKQNQQ